MARRSYRGNSVATTIAVGINAADTTLSVADGSGLPVGVNPFVVTVNANKAGEEKILVGGRSGNSLTGLIRGYDGTTAGNHLAGESVTHTISAADLDEANAHINDTARDDHTQYAFVKKGLATLRGAAARSMKFYYNTDSDLLSLDDGTAWHDFQSKAVADAAYRAQAAPAVRAWRSGTQLFTTGVGAVVALNAESLDTNIFHDNVTANSRLTVPAGLGGKYFITGQITWAAGAGPVSASVRQTAFIGGVTTFLVENDQLGNATTGIAVPVSTIETLADGDYIELIGFQTTGGNLNANGTDRSFTFLSMTRLGS